MAVQAKQESTPMVEQLTTEKDSLDESFVNARQLLIEAIEQSKTGGKKNGRAEEGFTYTDIMTPNRVKMIVRVRIPEKEHPKYNFIGKLLGPKGSSLKQLQADTGTRMSILGRNSMKDKSKEEELRNTGDPKHHHLTADLHVMIEAFCLPAEGYNRIGHALTEVKKFLIPDPNDDIRQNQLMDLGMPDGPPSRGGRGRGRGGPGRGMIRPLGAGPPSRTPPGSRGGPRGAPRGRSAPGRGRAAPMSLAYQSQEEEYYEEPYGESYETSYETGYEETGAAADGSYGYEESGAADYDYGGFSGGSQGAGYGTAASSASASYGGYGGSSGSSWGGASGGGSQRMKAPSQGYAPKTAARSHPYTRY